MTTRVLKSQRQDPSTGRVAVTVTVTLVGNDGTRVVPVKALLGDTVIEGSTTVRATTDTWTLALVPNDLLTPAGTAYRITERDSSREVITDRLVELVSGDGSDVWLKDLTDIVSPAAIDWSAFGQGVSDYTQLTNLPTLGTAAAQDATAFEPAGAVASEAAARIAGDATKVPTTRQIAGLDLSADRSAQAVADALAGPLSGAYARGLRIAPGAAGVVGNGTGDDTAAMQAILDQVSPALGVVDVYVADGTYMINGVNAAQSPSRNRWIGGGLKPKAGTRLHLSSGATLKLITNGSPGYSVIYLGLGQDNITIRGGKILGDRVAHDYTTDTSYPTHEVGYGIGMQGAQNIVIEDMTITNCTGDGIITESDGYLTVPPYNPCKRIVVRRCVLDNNRRNNLSLVATDVALVENCTITNAGATLSGNAGTNPKYGIDIEASYDGANALHENKHIVIRGNRLSGNANGSITNYNGQRVVIEGNHADNSISYGFGTDTIIRGNTIVNTTNTTGVGIGSNNGGAGTYKANLIEGNIVRGFATGIQASNKDATIVGNHVSEFVNTGIAAYLVTRGLIAANTVLDGSGASAIGVNVSGPSTEVAVQGNTIRNTRQAIVFAGAGNTSVVEGNTITKGYQALNISAGSTVTVKDNVIDLPGHADGQTYDVTWAGTSVVTFEGNIVRNSTTYPINATNAAGGVSRILGNRFIDTGAPLSLTGGKHEVIGNTLIGYRTSGSFTTGAILLASSDASVIEGNTTYTSGSVTFTMMLYVSSSTNTRYLGNTHFGTSHIANPAGSEVTGQNVLVNGTTVTTDASALGGGGGSSSALTRASGQYVRSGAYVGAAGSGTNFMSAGFAYYRPMRIGKGGTVTSVKINVTTAAASSVLRVGLYAHDASTGLPGTRVADLGTLDTSTTGAKTLTISQALSDDTVYWICAVAQGGSPTVSSTNESDPLLHRAPGANAGVAAINDWNTISGALPATADARPAAGAPVNFPSVVFAA